MLESPFCCLRERRPQPRRILYFWVLSLPTNSSSLPSYILEDELAATKLSLFAAQTQLEEQSKSHDLTVTTLRREAALAAQSEALRREHDSVKIRDLLAQVERLRSLSRENTRELLMVKKAYGNRERKLMEEKEVLESSKEDMKQEVQENQERVLSAERVFMLPVFIILAHLEY